MGSEIHGLVKLRCSVKKYDWGKVGKESMVARLYAVNSREEITDAEDDPYAELWMGTHNGGPSYVVLQHLGDSVTLKDWIECNPSVVGDTVFQKWGANLPFLFKVLSVAKSLSIQAHPDKNLAVILHQQHPELYKDDNHKPEMALALTEFEALCGFVDLQELKSVVHGVPEIIEMVGSSCADLVLQITEEDGENKAKEVLQSLFTELMLADKDVISQVISKLISRLNSKREVGELTEKEEVVLRLEKQYPGDIGVIAAFLFNYVKLQPGEALYLGANELHAYIQGDCIECMAASDNVVRAGLTPKNRDVKTLCSMLTYKQGFPEIIHGIPSNPYIVKWVPPFDEFEVDQCVLSEESSTTFPTVPGPCVFIATEGEGTISTSTSTDPISEGDILFACANTEVTVESGSGLCLYRAGVNSRFFDQ